MKKGVKIFIALLMVLSIAGCGVSTKEFSEIEKIFKENDYSFETRLDCSYALVENDDHRWVMLDGKDDLYFRDDNASDGSGIVDLADEKLYMLNDLEKECKSKDEKIRAKNFVKSSEKKLSTLGLSEEDVKKYIKEKWDEERKEYDNLSKKERFEKEFNTNYIKLMSDSLISDMYDFYCKNKYENFTYEDLCENYLKSELNDEILHYHKLLTENNNESWSIKVNGISNKNGNTVIAYGTEDDGDSNDVNYIILYDEEEQKISSISCASELSDDKKDFLVGSAVMLKKLTKEDYSGEEALAILSKAMDSPLKLDGFTFVLSTDDRYMFMAVPS